MTEEKKAVPQFEVFGPIRLLRDITANGGIHSELRKDSEHVGLVFQGEMWVEGFGRTKVQLRPQEWV